MCRGFIFTYVVGAFYEEFESIPRMPNETHRKLEQLYTEFIAVSIYIYMMNSTKLNHPTKLPSLV
jgi:hypothetical protein